MGNLKDEATHIDIDGYLWKDVVFDSEGNAKEGVYLEDTTWLHSYIKELKLKPIEKNEMKEFLVNHDNKWTLQLLDSDTEENSYRVVVPSEAECAILCREGNLYFWHSHFFIGGTHEKWIDMRVGYDADWYLKTSEGSRMVWQRSETEYLKSIAQLNNKDTVKVTIDELKHRVYKKDVSHLKIVDVYRVLELFNVQSHAVGHAIKKLLCSGDRGAKDEAQDIQEAIDSLIRYQEMKSEDK